MARAFLFLFVFITAILFIQPVWAGELIESDIPRDEMPAKVGGRPIKKEVKAPAPKKPVRKAAREVEEEELTPPAWFDMERLRKGLTYDRLRIRPRYRQEFELDDNVLLESGDERLDVIFREKPGVEFILPIDDHFVRLDYEAQFNQFAKNTQENFVNQTFNAEGALNFTNAYLNVNETILQTSERSGTTFTERIPRFENTVDVTAGYKWNRLLWEAGYQNFLRDFASSREESLNYHYNQFHTTQYIDLTEKAKLLVDYVLTGYQYPHDNTRDGLSNRISGGIKGYFFPKTALFSKFGYEHQQYDKINEREADTFVAEAGLQYLPFAGTVLDFGWQRQVVQSTFVDTNFFVENEFFGKLNQRITGKLSLISEVSYVDQDYDDPTARGAGMFPGFAGERNDDLFLANVGLYYAFTDWLSTDIKYQYSRRDSNASIYDYTDNLTTVGISAKV
ncbi:MAG: outer membrane beta-barrel protein [Candidatus Omnitrophica bacterium]|nr:outer membrane beta-barrel protein [Candidatus Omnitrophota bacterium]